MRILAIEPYYGGSHKAFITGWMEHSRHQFDLITFPPYKWKWRMRHSPVSAARKAAELLSSGKKWDLLFASDMLGLAEFCGLVPPAIASLPRIAYFHENQLLYPETSKQKRDMHYAYTNITTALAADKIWFNTGWHRDVFLQSCREFLKKMPDYQHLDQLETIRNRSSVHSQGIHNPPLTPIHPAVAKPLQLTWAARWEHDKNPADLYRLLTLLQQNKLDFRISIIGETFERIPEDFTRIQNEFSSYITRFGFQPSREEYLQALTETDIIISTAIHEFFGISIIEGCACGAIPLAPDRLAYPEVLDNNRDFLYANTPEALKDKLLYLSRLQGSEEWNKLRQCARENARKYYWENITATMDTACEELNR